MRARIKAASVHIRFVLLVLLACVLGHSAIALAQKPASELPFVLKQVGPGIFAAIDGPKGQSGSNSGFVIGDDSVLVIDSFYNPDAAAALVGEIRKRTDKPIRYLVNTHYHIDHVAGDGVLRDAGATIFAHRNERAWVRTENGHLFGKRLTPALEAKIAGLALPDVTITEPTTIWLGSRRVEIRPVSGHTGGDLVVSVPDANVVFCGDILWRHVSPNIIDGNVADWIDTVHAMQQAKDAAKTTFVPGHGDVAKVQDLAEFETYLTDLRRLVMKERAAGLSGEELVAAALPVFTQMHGDWRAFDHFAPLQLGFMDQELAGTKRVPQPVQPSAYASNAS